MGVRQTEADRYVFAECPSTRHPPEIGESGGDDGPRPLFAELKCSVTGISDSVLSERLSELAAAGLVLRIVEAGPSVALTYHATEAARR